MSSHLWVRAAYGEDRRRLVDGLELPPVLAVLDAHRRLRGPYSAAGALMRAIARDALRLRPELGDRHKIELLSSTPELVDVVPSMWQSLEWTVKDDERTRFYSRLHTLNLANGLAEFLGDYLVALDDGPRAVVFENAHRADPTDQEFISVLLRRTDLPLLRVVVCTGVEPLVDPPGELAVSLHRTLLANAVEAGPVGRVGAAASAPAPASAAPSSSEDAAREYVWGDGVRDDPRLLVEYGALPAQERARLHDERLAELEAAGEPSLKRGAIPYHAEHGSDPTGRGVPALEYAMDHCWRLGLYQASADLGLRGRELADQTESSAQWWHFTSVASAALASLGRAAEAERVYEQIRETSILPEAHMQVSYGMAMLYARHFPEPQRDFARARAWMNSFISMASLVREPKQLAVQSVFARNGLALVEVRQNKPDEALRLLNEGIDRLDRELEPDEHKLHRAVLRYNRAQVYGMTGRLEEALADYRWVAGRDPYFPEHHFNIGNILRRLGRNEEAVASYRRSLELSPPYPEVYYNIADALLELGDTDGAHENYSHVLQLDPDHVDAKVNRAGLRYELGDSDGAREDMMAGLAAAPSNTLLLCVKARLLADDGDLDGAREAIEAALAVDPGLAEAWAIRGQLAYETAELKEAIDYFDTAIDRSDGPEVRFNRAVAYQDAGRFLDAIADYDAVLLVLDDDEARQRREDCVRAEAAGAGVR